MKNARFAPGVFVFTTKKRRSGDLLLHHVLDNLAL
ncbi:hypothetical protein J2767_005060, partial [Agrobacterium tumefaciens]|nr:hypothetical protein [Agrobacterium tumefaciens]